MSAKLFASFQTADCTVTYFITVLSILVIS